MITEANFDPDASTVDRVTAYYERVISDALTRMEIDEVRQLVVDRGSKVSLTDKAMSPARQQAAEVLRRARRLPVGPDRNDLRQLAIGLIWLDKRGLASKVLRLV